MAKHFLLGAALLVGSANGHGFMTKPIARNAITKPSLGYCAWDGAGASAGGKPPCFGDFMSLGGTTGPDATGCKNAGRSGFVGSAADGFEGNGGIKTTYQSGEIIDVEVIITAYHGGKFEFRLQDVGQNSDPDGNQWASITPLSVLSFTPMITEARPSGSTESCSPYYNDAGAQSSASDIWGSLWGPFTPTAQSSDSSADSSSIWSSLSTTTSSPSATSSNIWSSPSITSSPSATGSGIWGKWGRKLRGLQSSAGSSNCAQITETTAADKGPAGLHTVRVQLPSDIQCDHCVLQWHWTSSNSCPTNGLACSGSEQFWNCADVEITGGNGGNSPTPPSTSFPTPFPTAFSTLSPTSSPTPFPSAIPGDTPTSSPTLKTTSFPTLSPTPLPTIFPTPYPSRTPTASSSTTDPIYPNCQSLKYPTYWIRANWGGGCLCFHPDIISHGAPPCTAMELLNEAP